MRNRILSLAILIFCAVASPGQERLGSVRGRVSERSTGQAVSGATVAIKATSETAITDAEGNYRLEIRPGVYEITISAKGFAPLIRNQVGVTGGRNVLLDVQLDVTLAESVDVRSSIFAENVEQGVSNVTLDREALRQTPGTGGDPLRALNSLPAVSAASAEFADLIVRGGTADENLVFVDRIPVDDFTYFTDKYDTGRGGRAAILAPDVFERVEFSAGGFGARYGDRMSSVLDVTIREAARERLQAVIFADSGTAGGSLEIPLGKKGSWLVSGRRTFIDVALDVAGIADLGVIGYPTTHDLTNKAVYDLTPRNKLSFTALNFLESFDQTDDQAVNIGRRTDRFRARRTGRRSSFGATLSSTLSSKMLAQTTAWLGINHNDGSFYLPFSSYLQRSRDLRDSKFGLKEDVNLLTSRRVEIAFGGGVTIENAKYHTFENAATFYSPLEEEFRAPPRENRLVDRSVSGHAYLQAGFRLTPNFSVTPGIRIDRFGLSGETLFSPRIAARFKPSDTTTFSFAAGVYRQPPGLFMISLAPENRSLRSQSATHLIGGFEWLIDANTRFRFEAFRKKYEDLLIQPIRPTQNYVVTGRYFNAGRGTSSGFEVWLLRSISGRFAGQAAYGYLRSTRTFDLDSPLAPSDLERPHQVVLIGIYQVWGFKFAAKYRVASGLPYTRRTPVRLTPGFDTFIHRIETTSDVNALRLPRFASLDLRAERRFSFRRWSFSPYLDYFNVTNHASIVQTNYEFFRQSTDFLAENKRLPIFGLRIEF